ncbi:MAG: hypothetical protein ACI8RD_012250, partial [Bacillariaceae sp.]
IYFCFSHFEIFIFLGGGLYCRLMILLMINMLVLRSLKNSFVCLYRGACTRFDEAKFNKEQK